MEAPGQGLPIGGCSSPEYMAQGLYKSQRTEAPAGQGPGLDVAQAR